MEEGDEKLEALCLFPPRLILERVGGERVGKRVPRYLEKGYLGGGVNRVTLKKATWWVLKWANHDTMRRTIW